MKIGARIAARRKELGLTQGELAVRVGYKTKSSINKIELGVNDLTQSKVVTFANALETTPGYLMGWEDGSGNEPIAEETSRKLEELTAEEQDLLSAFRNIKPEERGLVLAMVRAAVGKGSDG